MFNKKWGLAVAQKQVHFISNKLRAIDPESGSTYLEC
jgi:hypothetical protein